MKFIKNKEKGCAEKRIEERRIEKIEKELAVLKYKQDKNTKPYKEKPKFQLKHFKIDCLDVGRCDWGREGIDYISMKVTCNFYSEDDFDRFDEYGNIKAVLLQAIMDGDIEVKLDLKKD